MELRDFILNTPINLVDCVIDEVALEGLDGITLEALWQRLSVRLQEELPLPDAFMEQIWSICVSVREFSFYELKKAREPLIIFDRFELLNDGDSKRKDIPKDIYPHFPIDDIKNGIRGSCSSYNTRKDITYQAKNFALHDILEVYNQKFVIVASQKLRERVLINDTVCPLLEINVLQYCYLERVGRARYHGDVTHGKSGLSTLTEDPKSMFYHRKFLLKHKLITKQAYCERISGNSYSSSLIHLTRFYVERKPKFVTLSEKVVDYLKTKENCFATYDELKEHLQLKIALKKVFRTPLLKNLIRTDIKVSPADLQLNSNNRRKDGTISTKKMVRALQLIDPNIDVNQFWGKHDGPEEEESYELDSSQQKLNVPYLKQANHFVEEARQTGLSQSELGIKIGMTKLNTRTMLRNLVKTKIVATYMNDVGKQRVTRYISKKYEHSSEMSKQLEQEMDKMKEFNRSSREENETLPPNVPIEVPIDVLYPMQNEIIALDKVQNVQVRKDESLLATINRIFSKYRKLKSRTRYKYTSLNLSQLQATAFWNPSQNKFGTVIQNNDETPILPHNDQSLIKDVRVKLVCSRPHTMLQTKSQVTGFFDNLKKAQKNVTYRLLKRANIVIEAVKAQKVIDDPSKLLKLIKAEEDKEGYNVRIDKKSIARLLQKLVKDNLVKYIKVTLSDGDRQRIVTYICDPSIDKDHSLIQSAIEQAKIKFCLLKAPPLNLTRKSSDTKKKKAQNNQENLSTTDELILDSRIGKKYGYDPKFLRMKILHILLFYLNHEHPGNPKISKEEQIKLFQSEGIIIDDKLAAEMNEIYTKEISWKMFIPPLTKHPDWPDGWALMCDVLLRLPLSIFTKLYNIPYVIPGIEAYLDHPIRKHFLVKDLPPYLRNPLLKSRKYIFSIHETVSRLCYLGLLQFGPQSLKGKDQVFIYLNRRSQLMDTTSSAIGYHKIEEKSYPIIKYEFNCLADVEKYWYQMWEICIDTCLGGRLAVQGKDILLEDLSRKAAMIVAVKPRSQEEVYVNDNGEVPGDRRGAAGIDSAFFAHLKRNWTWGFNSYTYQHYKSAKYRKRNYQVALGTHEDRVHQVEEKRSSGRNSRDSFITDEEGSNNKVRSTKTTIGDSTLVKKFKPILQQQVKKGSKRKAYVRRVLPRKKTLRKRVKYDEIDYKALQQMDKLRVDWEPHEDNILLMCKVAMMYLFPNPRKQYVAFTAVRDVLRCYSSSSQNKTSRACQRRLLYMLKQPQTISSVMLGIEEIKQNYFINKRFHGLVDRIKTDCHDPNEYEDRIIRIFKELVAYIAKRYYNISDMESKDPIVMPKTVHEFNFLYEVRHPSKTLQSRGFTKDVKNINDIKSATINTVIHSSMCSGKDRRTWAYQLFKIYQQYPESLLKAAMFKIRADQMVSIKKSCNSALQKYGNCMPMSSSQYQLSLCYYYKFQTKWPYSVYHESYSLLLKLIQWQCEYQVPENNYAVPEEIMGTKVIPITGGIVAGIQDFFTKDQINFEIEVPNQVIMLDPRLQERDEVYLRIAKRYQSLLMNCAYANQIPNNQSENSNNRGEKKRKHQDNENDEVQQETETHESDNRVKTKSEVKLKTIDLNNGGDSVEEKLSVKKRQNLTIEDISESDRINEIKKNTVFLKEPQIISTQNEGIKQIEFERIDIRSIKRCIESEDENLGGAPKRLKLKIDEEKAGPVIKRLRQEAIEEIEDYNDNNYMENCEQSNTLINESETAIEIDSAEEAEIEREIFTDDPLFVDNENDDTLDDLAQIESTSNDNETIDSKFTNLGMLKIREEFSDISFADSHHAHDCFVVNPFNIFYSLKLSETDKPRELKVHQGYQVPAEIIPLNMNIVNKLIDRLKAQAIFPENRLSNQEFKQALPEYSEADWNLINGVCQFIKEKGEMGASAQELSGTFHKLGRTIDQILNILIDYQQIMRSGVTIPRYIHQNHADPWLIHSYKILRLEQEAQRPVTKRSVYVFENEYKTKKNGEKRESKQEKLNESMENLQQETNTASNRDDSEVSDEIPTDIDKENLSLRRSLRKRTGLLKESDVFDSAKLLDLNTTEEIKVIIKPWIRVDGTLNRRVLDRMMGAILSYCIKYPGTTLNKIQNRFVPALHPFHTRNLVEMLLELGCLNSRAFKTPQISLFSSPAQIQFTEASVLTADEELVIEPEIGATLRFGTYLSNKNYNSDFLS